MSKLSLRRERHPAYARHSFAYSNLMYYYNSLDRVDD